MTHSADPEVTLPEPYGRVSLNQILQKHNQRLNLTLFLLISLGTGTDTHSLTCLTTANPMLSDHVVNQAAFLIRRQSFFQQHLLRLREPGSGWQTSF